MQVRKKGVLFPVVFTIMGLFFFGGCESEHRFVKKTTFKGPNSIVIEFAGPVDEGGPKTPRIIPPMKSLTRTSVSRLKTLF